MHGACQRHLGTTRKKNNIYILIDVKKSRIIAECDENNHITLQQPNYE